MSEPAAASAERPGAVVPLPPIARVEHRFVDVGGARLHVAEAGDGPPLVLVHGWPQHWYCWRRVVPLLAGRHRLVMPDLRGFGWSDAPAGGYDKEQLATDVLRLLDVVAPDEPVGYVGHDWGGWVGFLTALRAPERLSGFLALGIVHPFQRLSWQTAAQAWRGAYQVALGAPIVSPAALRASPRLVAGVIAAGTARADTFTAGERRAYGEILQQPARAQASSRLYRTFLLREVPALRRYRSQRLTVPTRLVVGARDVVANSPLLDGWQRHADAMTVEVVPGLGHFLPEEAPELVARHVGELFA